MHERYSIDVANDCVLIHGNISIREAFDFLSFFEQQGFNSLTYGEENSAMCLLRTSIKEMREEQVLKEKVADDLFYETLYNSSQDEIKKLRDKISHLESLMKEMLNEEKNKRDALKIKIDSMKRENAISNLLEDPLSQKIIEQAYYAGLDYPSGWPQNIVNQEGNDGLAETV